MYKLKSQTEQYNVLPPRTEHSKPTQGHFCVSLTRFQSFVQKSIDQKHLVFKFKMWGQQTYHYLSPFLSNQIKYQVKCKNHKFLEYLRDMKSMKFDLIDSRNQKIIGFIDLNLLLFLMPIVSSSVESPLASISQFMQIKKLVNKHATKIGQIQVRVQSKFFDTANKLAIISTHPPRIYQNTTIKLQTFEIKKQESLNNKIIDKVEPEKRQIAVQILKQTNPNKPIQLKQQDLLFRKYQSFTPKYDQKLQKQLIQLQIQSHQLLSNQISKDEGPNFVELLVHKITLNKTQQIYLELTIPVVINNQIAYQTITFTPSKFTKTEVLYNNTILLNNYSQVKQYFVYIKGRNKQKEIILTLQIQCSYLEEKQAFEFEMNSKYKCSAKLYISSKKVNQKQKQNVQQLEVKQFQSSNLFMLFTLGNVELIDWAFKRVKIVFYHETKQYSVEQVSNQLRSHQMIVTCKQIISNPICFEVWRLELEDQLIGIGKVTLPPINSLTQIQNHRFAINSTLLYDQRLKIINILKDKIVGHLPLKIYIGSIEQINKHLQKNTIQSKQTPIQKPHATEIKENELKQYSQLQVESAKKLDSKSAERQIRRDESQEDLSEINLSETLTKFFDMLTGKKQKVQFLINGFSNREHTSVQEFSKFLATFLVQQETQLIWILTNFFAEEDQVKIIEFYKCFSSYLNFREIVIEQRKLILKELIDELVKLNMALDVFEQKINKRCQFSCLPLAQFKKFCRKQKLTNRLENRLIENYDISQQNPLNAIQFISNLKAVKFDRVIESAIVKMPKFCTLITQSIQQTDITDITQIKMICNTLSTKDLSHKNVCLLFQALKIEISYWQSLLLVEHIKKVYRQDLQLNQGLISQMTILQWLKSIVDAKTGESKVESSYSQHNIKNEKDRPDIKKKLQTEKSEYQLKQSKQHTAEDQIVNIANLLKQKSNLQQLEQSKFSKQPIAPYNRSDNNILIASNKINNISQDSIKKQPPIQNLSKQQRIVRYLLKEVKLFQEFRNKLMKLTLKFNQVKEIIFNIKQDQFQFLSARQFQQSIDFANIDYYKYQGLRGMEIIIKQFQQNSEIAKGLITLQDLFQRKKSYTCVLYNRHRTIVGKAILDVPTDKKQDQQIRKNSIFMRLCEIHSDFLGNTFLNKTLEIFLNEKFILQTKVLEQALQIVLDKNEYLSKLKIRVKHELKQYQTIFATEGLFTQQVILASLPLTDRFNVYSGLLKVQFSRVKQYRPSILEINEQKISRLAVKDIYIIIQDVIVLQKLKRVEGYFRIEVNSQVVARNHQLIQLQCIEQFSYEHWDNLVLKLSKISQSSEIKISLVSIKNESEIIGHIKLKLSQFSDKVYHSKSDFIFQNKTNCIRLGIKYLQVQNPLNANIDRILNIFTDNNILKIRKYLQQTKDLKLVLKDYFQFTFSQVDFLYNNLFKHQLDLQKLFSEKHKTKTLTKKEAFSLYKEFEFYDNEHKGNIPSEKLKEILNAYQLHPQATNSSHQDYMKYLRYRKVQTEEDFNLKSIFNSIDKLHLNILSKLN